MAHKSPMSYKYIGVLIYSYNDFGELVFLLGQEQKEKGWSDELKWSDFGGSPEIIDQSIYHSASRECYEEGMGFLGNQKEILDYLISKKEAYVTQSSVVFSMKIKYDSNLPRVYSNVYNYMTTCMIRDNKGTSKVPSCPKGLFEKIAIKWYTTNEIVKSRMIMRPSFYDFFIKNIVKS